MWLCKQWMVRIGLNGVYSYIVQFFLVYYDKNQHSLQRYCAQGYLTDRQRLILANDQLTKVSVEALGICRAPPKLLNLYLSRKQKVGVRKQKS